MQFKFALISLFAALAIAAPEVASPELEKRCTANGGSCTQLSQCCSGNCEYDSSIGLVCKAARKFKMEKRCTANGGSCTQLSQCCSGNCEYDSSIGLVCKP
ncbi:hypothetical protein BFW01_g917 [Lasiodiplodia theobromae]|uniref:Uncharacterized protein n=2 Tax=Lasiodiplodia TaxID=66739 RepID=A0A5N5CX97_9PEZI|nr:O-superfamily protein [Lasiodiplodia theobromae]KAB2569989.1 hypothetical protein DBV05_g11335 [Lasiodiplodia theobromae]KAF4546258.1 O-superfamily protein [Lasiodiplodia theobromae]KAF9630355.1 hypothetical protein BFW01_g917 [Lasiodiplodia theobromae]KAK0653515.1 hypothetical protein DIS24_g5932 [Lasiodiplodia hormozganensis]